MKIRKMVLSALLIACSFVGANIKVLGSIAFDSLPGFIGALLLGPAYGAGIGAIGHLLTALLAGFPLTPAVHGITMLIMAATMAIFGGVYKRFAQGNARSLMGALLAAFAAILVNAPIALLILTPLLQPVIGTSGILALLPVLSVVAAVNIFGAFVLYWLVGANFTYTMSEKKHES